MDGATEERQSGYGAVSQQRVADLDGHRRVRQQGEEAAVLGDRRGCVFLHSGVCAEHDAQGRDARLVSERASETGRVDGVEDGAVVELRRDEDVTLVRAQLEVVVRRQLLDPIVDLDHLCERADQGQIVEDRHCLAAGRSFEDFLVERLHTQREDECSEGVALPHAFARG